MDSWEPAELAWFSAEACGHVADLYNLIEDGADWPEGAQKARAAFLGKDENILHTLHSGKVGGG